jgi:alkanesulfonate monooxygenase SsuD/methylene tetrahydromethanopterin reductase-like flavin-dependent oxidoreductase (luciferase family)
VRPTAGTRPSAKETDKVIRGELLDEGLDIMRGLWAGQPFRHEGKHYKIQPSEFPAIGHTAQKPGVPVWCVGALGSKKSMTRALACDG